MDWFLYDIGLRRERVNKNFTLFEQFEEYFCDALLSVKTFWKR